MPWGIISIYLLAIYLLMAYGYGSLPVTNCKDLTGFVIHIRIGWNLQFVVEALRFVKFLKFMSQDMGLTLHLSSPWRISNALWKIKNYEKL